MKNINTVMLVLSVAAIAGLLSLAGCGGGASETPRITVKPAENGSPKNDGPIVNVEQDPVSKGFGTFKGRVIIKGTPDTLAALVLKGAAARDPAVCAATGNIPDQGIEGENGGLANVFIYLKKAPKNGKDHAGHEATAEIIFDQKGCIFSPHALVARTKTTIIVKNSDDANHNVRTKPLIAQPFNEILTLGKLGKLIYDKAEKEPCPVECNFHAWMKAYHLPLDHPYGVVTKADGSFEIQDLPVGTHRFVIWHERARSITQRFTVEIKADGETVTETIEVDASKLK